MAKEYINKITDDKGVAREISASAIKGNVNGKTENLEWDDLLVTTSHNGIVPVTKKTGKEQILISDTSAVAKWTDAATLISTYSSAGSTYDVVNNTTTGLAPTRNSDPEKRWLYWNDNTTATGKPSWITTTEARSHMGIAPQQIKMSQFVFLANNTTAGSTEKLLPGQIYEITDYAPILSTTGNTAQYLAVDMTYRTPLTLYVLATSENSYCEDAFAKCLVDGVYRTLKIKVRFSSNALNDYSSAVTNSSLPSEFEWASTTTPVVIYYMENSLGLTAGFDYLNIACKKNYSAPGTTQTDQAKCRFTFNNSISALSQGAFSGKFQEIRVQELTATSTSYAINKLPIITICSTGPIQSITFGVRCENIHLGPDSWNTSFGNRCSNIYIKTCQYSTFEDSVSWVVGSTTTTAVNSVTYSKFGAGTKYISATSIMSCEFGAGINSDVLNTGLGGHSYADYIKANSFKKCVFEAGTGHILFCTSTARNAYSTIENCRVESGTNNVCIINATNLLTIKANTTMGYPRRSGMQYTNIDIILPNRTYCAANNERSAELSLGPAIDSSTFAPVADKYDARLMVDNYVMYVSHCQTSLSTATSGSLSSTKLTFGSTSILLNSTTASTTWYRKTIGT